MAESHQLTWQYLRMAVRDSEALSNLGREGWELVAIDRAIGMYVFKRPEMSLRERVALEQKTRVYAQRIQPGDVKA